MTNTGRRLSFHNPSFHLIQWKEKPEPDCLQVCSLTRLDMLWRILYCTGADGAGAAITLPHRNLAICLEARTPNLARQQQATKENICG